MNLDQIVSDSKQRKLHVDFVEMLLVQNKPGADAISYRGKGFICQTEDDTLTFNLYAINTYNTDFLTDLRRSNDTETGQVYPAESYYRLDGIASDGFTWTAEQILPVCDWNSEHPNPIIRGKLSYIIRGKLSQNPKSIVLHFFEKADLPVLIREAKFKVAGCEFHVENYDDSFVVRATSEAPLPEHFAMRIEEALRFLLAQSVTPRAIVQPQSIKLTSTTLKSPMVRLGPPISRGSAAFRESSWDLFATYLRFVIRKTRFGNWNPCTGYLQMAHEASANSLDAWATGLGVTVEGLASLIRIEKDQAEKEKSKVENERLKKLQDFIVKQVSSRKNLAGFTERVQGLVGGLTSVRPIDRMTWLADHGGADLAHVQTWRKLRNRGVHPATKGDVDVASIDFQKRIDELHCVTVLLYHIVFHVIGYHGPYTDYGTRGFPEKSYPLS